MRPDVSDANPPAHAPIPALPRYFDDERTRRRFLDGLFDGTALDEVVVAREALAVVGPSGLVLGLDPSAGMLDEAKTLAIPLTRGLGERLPYADASFDFVSMGFALRHVADLDALFGEMRRVLRPGGTACILEITYPSRRIAAAPLRFFMTQVVPLAALSSQRRASARALMRFYWDTIAATASCCSRRKSIRASTSASRCCRPTCRCSRSSAWRARSRRSA